MLPVDLGRRVTRSLIATKAKRRRLEAENARLLEAIDQHRLWTVDHVSYVSPADRELWGNLW
jgi:hypothetical protein